MAEERSEHLLIRAMQQLHGVALWNNWARPALKASVH